MTQRNHPIFKNFLKRREDCPEKDVLIKAFLDELEIGDKFKLLDHVFSCPECFLEFQSLKDIWRKTRSLSSALKIIPPTEIARKNIINLAEMEIQKLKTHVKDKNKIFHGWQKISALGASIGILALIAIVLVSRGPRETAIERKGTLGQIMLLEPKGEIKKPGLIFSWSAIEEADRYRLEIFDKGLDLFYKKEQIGQNQFILPEHVFRGLNKGEIYFWKVTAHLKDSQEFESDFSKFVIKKK